MTGGLARLAAMARPAVAVAGLMLLVGGMLAPALAHGKDQILDRYLGGWAAQVTVEPGLMAPGGGQVVDQLIGNRVSNGTETWVEIFSLSNGAQVTRRFNAGRGLFEMRIAGVPDEFGLWTGQWREADQSFQWRLVNPLLAGRITERFADGGVSVSFQLSTPSGQPLLTGTGTASRP